MRKICASRSIILQRGENMRKKSLSKIVGNFFGFILVAALVTGCSSGMFSSQSSAPKPIDELDPVATMVESYSDIELPLEMTFEGEKSMSLRTDTFQSGIYYYSGRVQIASLKDYIIASMRNNKWQLRGEAAHKKAMLAFTKPNKTCMVVLSEEGFNEALGKTAATFYVTVDSDAAKQSNPFGAQN